MKKFVSNYQNKLRQIASDEEHTEPSYYEILIDLFNDKLESKYSIMTNPSTSTGKPDLKIKKRMNISDFMNFAVIEVKDFIKWDKKTNSWIYNDISLWFDAPGTNNDSKRFYEQIYRYSNEGELVLVTNMLKIWIINKFEKISPPSAMKKIPVLYSYELCTFNLKDPITIIAGKNFEDEFNHLLDIIHLFDGDKIKDSKKLRKLLMKYIKSNEATFNLKDEILRILTGPQNVKEIDFKNYLMSILNDINVNLLNEDEHSSKFVDFYVS